MFKLNVLRSYHAKHRHNRRMWVSTLKSTTVINYTFILTSCNYFHISDVYECPKIDLPPGVPFIISVSEAIMPIRAVSINSFIGSV